MENVHTFEGVHCIPLKFITDKDRKRISAEWLSKQMVPFGYDESGHIGCVQQVYSGCIGVVQGVCRGKVFFFAMGGAAGA